jgi:hypothetical protein
MVAKHVKETLRNYIYVNDHTDTLLVLLCRYFFLFACYYTIRRSYFENMELSVRHSLCITATVSFLKWSYSDIQTEGLWKIISDGTRCKKEQYSLFTEGRDVTSCPFLVRTRFLFPNTFSKPSRHINNIPFHSNFIKGVAKFETKDFEI